MVVICDNYNKLINSSKIENFGKKIGVISVILVIRFQKIYDFCPTLNDTKYEIHIDFS